MTSGGTSKPPREIAPEDDAFHILLERAYHREIGADEVLDAVLADLRLRAPLGRLLAQKEASPKPGWSRYWHFVPWTPHPIDELIANLRVRMRERGMVC